VGIVPGRAGPYPRELLCTDAAAAARLLIGALLVRETGAEVRVGRIVEVEAYAGEEDRASHARFGRTSRNAVMFGRPGVAYVYLVYGMHNCLNVVTASEGRAAAVLIRAVEPIGSVAGMRRARLANAVERAKSRGSEAATLARQSIEALPAPRLASGPGLVCAAFSIDRADTGVDLCDPTTPLRLETAADDEPLAVATAPRVGIAYAAEPWRSLEWRFFVPGNPAISAVRPQSDRPGR
jgi:DNA-3-methyladenine glycosylase